MAGSVAVGIDALPTAFAVTGGGNYCPGGAGVNVGLGGSVAGISYQLYNGASPAGSALTGTGVAISFGLQTTAGSYTVVATNGATGCSAHMSGMASVGLNALPAVYNVIGGGNYCEGGAGVHVGLNNSALGINYQLLKDGSATGAPVSGVAGSPLDFGFQTVAGVYTVMATDGTTGCSSLMSGSATVSVTLPVVPGVTLSTGLGDTVCAGHLIILTALATNGGSAPAYSWTINGNPQPATGSNLSYLPADGDVVTVTMTSSAACATPASVNASKALTVLDNGTPTVTLTAAPGEGVCQGTTVAYSLTTAFGGAPTFTWVVNGANVGTDVSYTYVPTNNDVVYVIMNSTYKCRSENTVQSNHITMSVQAPIPPTVTISADPGTNVGRGQTLTLTAAVANGGSAPVYQWYINGAPISGANQPTLVGSNYNNGDSVTCQVVSNGTCSGLTGSNSVLVHVSSVGVAQVATTAGDIQLVPNPNRGVFVVKGTLGVTADEEVSLEITDMLGQVIYKNKVTAYGGNINEQIRLNRNIANGMYLMNLRSESANKVFHIVIEQ